MSCIETDFCTSTGETFKLQFTHLEVGGAVVPVSGDVYKLAIRKKGAVSNALVIGTDATPPDGSTATLNLTTGDVDFIVSAAAKTLIGSGLCTYAVQHITGGAPEKILMKGDLNIEEGLFP